MKIKTIIGVIGLLCCVAMGHSQGFTVTAAPTSANTLIQQYLAGDGVVLSNGTTSGSATQFGIFNRGNVTNFPISSGIVMTSGTYSNVSQNSQYPYANSSTGPDVQTPDTNLSKILSNVTFFDRAALDFDFVAFSDTVAFNYVFASEEYPDYVCSDMNDVFGFFVTGYDPVTNSNHTWNVALLPNSVTPVTINTVNGGTQGQYATLGTPCVLTNNQYYTQNSYSSPPIFNGYTKKLTASATIMACRNYHMHLAVADVNDNAFDSGVFLEEGSFYSPSVEMDTAWDLQGFGDTLVQNCRDVDVEFRLPRPVVSGNYHAQLLFPATHAGIAAVGRDYKVTTTVDTNTVELNTQSPPFYYNQGDSVVKIHVAIVDTAHFEPGEVKEAIIIITTIFCEDFWPQYLSAGRVDTLRFHLKGNAPIEVKDTLVKACQVCDTLGVKLSSGTEPLVYRWIPATDLTNPNAQLTAANIRTNRTYKLIAADRYGCLADTAEVKVTIHEKPTAAAVIDPPYGCVPLTLDLTAPGVPDSCDFRWIVNQDTIADTSRLAHYRPVLSQTGSYDVRLWVASAPGCIDSVKYAQAVYVSEAPHASFYFVPENPQNGKDVFFYNQSPESDLSYHWDFGDGTSSDEADPVHRYRLRESKNVLVRFTVTNEYGCSDDTTAWAPIVDNFAFFVPSAFTPNGDGKNEVFLPKVNDVDFYQLDIFNRQGQLIFHTTDTEASWDGTVGDTPAPPGVYVWRIKYSRAFNPNDIIPREGTVTLLR